MDQRVEEFFSQYEKANLSSDIPHIGSLYAETFLFGGPNGTQAVKRDDFIKVIPQMKAYLLSLGLIETRLKTLDAESLDSQYVLAKVEWRMSVRTTAGIQHLCARATYILIRGRDALSIVLQIDHQDLMRAIKDLLGHSQGAG
jgi:ketosteroid isomerase-like protein